MHYVDTDFHMMRLRMRCICDFVHNLKHSSQMASGSSWTDITMCGEVRGLGQKVTAYLFLCICVE
jgi:hypothetical protein